MNELNESQKQAVNFSGKHLLVLAGAGTGKTKTIVARAEYLLNSGVQPHQLAILSFTRKSAREIAERLKLSVASNVNKKAISGKTFHSWCNEIMYLHPKIFPQHRFTPLDEDDRHSAMALAIGDNFRDSSNEKIKKEVVVAIYSYAINTCCSLSEAIYHIRYIGTDKNCAVTKQKIEEDKLRIAPVIQKYMTYKQERQYIDYDDMLSIVADALEKNQEVRALITSRYTHVLVDEVQDTNPLQYKLLKSFVEKSHLFCVGDDAQSIYAFRGADFKTIHSFTDVIADSEVQKLELNYRSTQEILDLSNWLLQQSTLQYNKKLRAYRGSGEKPNLIHVQDDWEEAGLITDQIAQVIAEGGTYKDNMVLGRSGWSLSKVEGACLKKKIPYVKFGGTSLMQSAHVRDIVSAMRIAANAHDEIAWVRYLQLWDGIGAVTASKVIAEIIWLETLDQMIEKLQGLRLRTLVDEIPQTLQEVKQFIHHPAEAMQQALNHMQDILSRKYKDEWSYRSLDFEVLQEVAKASGNISEFITEYILDPKAETTLKLSKDNLNDVVILSTIHSAKGLEAKNVHVTSVNPMSYPSSRALQQGEDAIEEERRCLYVALTRAKDRLNLYRFENTLRTQYVPDIKKLSHMYFFNDLPSDLVKISTSKQVMQSTPVYHSELYEPLPFPDFNFD